MDWTIAFSPLTPLTVVLVIIAGSMLGLYFGALNQWKRPDKIIAGFISFVIIGWSFYLPLIGATLAEGRPFAERLVGSMILWVVFTFAAAAANVIVSDEVSNRRAAKLATRLKKLNEK